jgi:hypothetical protein
VENADFEVVDDKWCDYSDYADLALMADCAD